MAVKQPKAGSREHIPIRSCIVCRNSNDKRHLVRLVRTKAGIEIDHTGKMDGRGAYLCDSPVCWHEAATANVLNKALRTTMTEADRSRIKAYGKAL